MSHLSPIVACGGLISFLFIKSQVLLSHIHRPISWGYLDRFVVSPAVHSIHHSRNKIHYDSNYGTTLTWWDHLFGTYFEPRKEDLKNFVPGIAETPTEIAGRFFPVRFLFFTLTKNSIVTALSRF